MKTKAQISCTVIVQLICALVFPTYMYIEPSLKFQASSHLWCLCSLVGNPEDMLYCEEEFIVENIDSLHCFLFLYLFLDKLYFICMANHIHNSVKHEMCSKNNVLM